MFLLLLYGSLLAADQMPNRNIPPLANEKASMKATDAAIAAQKKAEEKTAKDTEQKLVVKNDADLGVPEVLIVLGAPGASEYEKAFHSWMNGWEIAAKKGGAKVTLLGEKELPEAPVKDRLRAYLQKATADRPLWIVLIGHGTDDGKECRFNLIGPDVSATEMKSWLEKLKRPIALIHCGSSSAPFLKALSAPGRVIVTATRSGSESNYARFGKYLAQALGETRADLDLDGQVSLLEAFLFASAGVAEFYKGEGRLATEHALIDDNGDGLGSQADWFQGIRAVKKAGDGAQVDGQRAHQWHLIPSEKEKGLSAAARKKRDELELKLFQWRDQKARLNEDDYYQGLEKIVTELGAIYLESSKVPLAP